MDDEKAELRQSLAQMGLIEADEMPEMTILRGGVSSTIVRARLRSGPVCVKRARAQLNVTAAWFAPLERSHAEVAWLKLVADVDPAAVPRVLGEDRERHTFAMSWLPPERYPVWKNLLRDGDIDTAAAAEVGRRLALIHAATAGRAAIETAFAHDAQFHALRLEPYFGAAALVHPDCAPALNALIERTAAARIALMHGDVSPKNILIGPDGPVFLDAECACYGDPAFDLAFCLNHLLLKSLWRPASLERLLDCFNALSETYFGVVNWEPRGAIESRSCELLAGLLLARVDGKSPVEYLTEPGDLTQVRQFSRSMFSRSMLSQSMVSGSMLAPSPMRLGDVAAEWRAACEQRRTAEARTTRA